MVFKLIGRSGFLEICVGGKAVDETRKESGDVDRHIGL